MIHIWFRWDNFYISWQNKSVYRIHKYFPISYWLVFLYVFNMLFHHFVHWSLNQVIQTSHGMKRHLGFSENGYIEGLVQDCSISITHTLEMLQYCTHRRNTPSARVPLLTAPSAGSIYLFAQFPTPPRVLLSRGLSGGSSKPPTHCSRQAFEATFDKLQLIRTTLISKMIKTL